MLFGGLGSGIEGYSVVRFASETLGLGLAAQRHAAAFFGEGLAKRLVAAGVVVVAESGILTADDVRRLEAAGADAVLVGEALMREPDVGRALARLRGTS